MPTVNVRQFEESFIIHFGGDFSRINAYTLAATLVGLADAAKAANTALNPGYEIEIVVEALGHGSFKAKIRAVYRAAGNLFSKDNLKQIVLGVIATYIFQEAFAPDQQVQVNVNSEEVVISQGDTKVIVPREVHRAAEDVRRIPQFRESIGRAFESIGRDEKISSFGISHQPEDSSPLIEVPREQFAVLSAGVSADGGDTREVVEITELHILRAILERSRRRWEFVWRGMRISAPVLDDKFYEDFSAHTITIAPGDSLEVRLRVRQRRHADSGIYLNDPKGYEVVEVLRHIPRPRQEKIEPRAVRLIKLDEEP